VSVVDLFGTLTQSRVLITLDVPDAIWQSTTLGACDFLLLESPIWKLDLVREESAAGHNVNELELGLDRTQTFLCNSAVRQRLDDFYTEEVISVTVKAFVAVGRNFVLPFGLTDWWSDIVRVKSAICGDVVKLEDRAVHDPRGVKFVPGSRSIDCFASSIEWLSLVLKQPDIVLVLVWVERDLLLLAAGWVHVNVRMKITTLCVVVTECNSAAESDVGWGVSHALVIQGGLEFRRHEAIALAWVCQAEEMDSKHGHVKGDWDNDQAENASEEMLEPKSRGDILRISEENPQLQDGQAAHPGNGEQTDPFTTDSRTKTKTAHGEPRPPLAGKCFARTLFVNIGECHPGQSSKSSEDDQGRVKQNQT